MWCDGCVHAIVCCLIDWSVVVYANHIRFSNFSEYNLGYMRLSSRSPLRRNDSRYCISYTCIHTTNKSAEAMTRQPALVGQKLTHESAMWKPLQGNTGCLDPVACDRAMGGWWGNKDGQSRSLIRGYIVVIYVDFFGCVKSE